MSPGKIENYAYQQPGQITAKLYNFEIDKFDLKQEHSNYLINVVVPILKRGGSLSIVGLAIMYLTERRYRVMIAGIGASHARRPHQSGVHQRRHGPHAH